MRIKPVDEDYSIINIFRIVINSVILLIALKIGLLLPILVLGVTLASSLAWYFLEKRKIIHTPRTPRAALIPTTFDILEITVIIVISGNINSIFIAGYYLTILVCSMNIRIRQGEYAVILSLALFVASGVLVLLGFLPRINFLGGGTEISLSSFIISAVLNGIGFSMILKGAHHQILQTKTLVNRLENSEKQLTRQNDIVKLLLRDFEDQSSDWLYELDAELRITYISTKVQRIAGENTVQGRAALDLLGNILPEGDEEAERLYRELVSAFRESRPFNDLEMKIVFNNTPFWLALSAIPQVDGRNRFIGWHGVGRNITEKKLLEIELFRKAYYDEPSGLANRSQFQKILDTTLDGLPEADGILGIIKLGKLDEIRTNLGSTTSNSVINVFIGKVYESFGRDTVLCRLERNEFAFWLVSPDIDKLEAIHRFSREMNEPLPVGSDLLGIDLYIGIAFYPDDATDRRGLFRAADLALITAQAPASRKFVRYREDLATGFLDRLNLVQELPNALNNGQFFMLYQPQVSAATRDCVGVEALIRWKHPEKGLVSPGEFIPLAEQTGFIIPLGEWILTTVCREAALWKEPLPVSVNVSGVELRDTRRLRHTIMAALDGSGLPPGRLTIEITESAVIGGREEIALLFDELQKLGILVALDDFGTGYSSLSYMQNMHLNKVKIDQSFVRNIGVSEKSERLVKVMLDMSKSMGLSTVAEGIETGAQAAFLQAHGCDWLQGYLFGKPMRYEDIRRAFLPSDPDLAVGNCRIS